MRGRAYRRHAARTKYARRINLIFYSSGGYKISDTKLERCESVKDYIESVNPYILKRQGNFNHHSNIIDKLERTKLLKKDRQTCKQQLQNYLA